MDGLTVGRIVHYVLSEQDAGEINDRRKAANQAPKAERLPGAQYYNGNRVEAGQHVAMGIVAVWNQDGLINGKCFLDGTDEHWVTSKSFDNEEKKPYTWHWIEKA